MGNLAWLGIWYNHNLVQDICVDVLPAVANFLIIQTDQKIHTI